MAHSSRQRSPAAFARGPWAIPVPNGFWSVYGIGRFGAFLVELHTIYQKANGASQATLVLFLLMIVASGGLVVLYGTQDVNALLSFDGIELFICHTR